MLIINLQIIEQKYFFFVLSLVINIQISNSSLGSFTSVRYTSLYRVRSRGAPHTHPYTSCRYLRRDLRHYYMPFGSNNEILELPTDREYVLYLCSTWKPRLFTTFIAECSFGCRHKCRDLYVCLKRILYSVPLGSFVVYRYRFYG